MMNDRMNKKRMEFLDEEKVLHKIAQEDRRSKKNFIMVCLIGGIIGGIVGGCMVFLLSESAQGERTFVEIWAELQLHSVFFFRFLLIVSGLIIYSIALAYYRRAKKLWSNVEQREENWETIDNKAGMAIALIGVLTVWQITLFALGMYMVPKTFLLSGEIISYIITLICHLFLVLGGLSITKKAVNLIKEMNPGKRGSVYDMKFKEKWYQSCDEAERMQIGVAAYKAYFATSYCCLFLIVILTFLCMVFELGMLPVFCVGIVWMTQTITYQIAVFKRKGMTEHRMEE